MARLLLLHTGGTLGMAPSGDPSSLAPGPYLDHVLERVPELRDLAELQVEVPFNCDSASMSRSTSSDWRTTSAAARPASMAWC